MFARSAPITYENAIPKILTQRTLLQIQEVLLDVLNFGSTNYHRVAEFALHETVMREPAQSYLTECEVVLVRDSSDVF